MKYYVVTDVHGFYSILHKALDEAGFFAETQPHKLLVLGDLFDRGTEAKKLQDFILEQMENGSVIMVRGNHEDLYAELVTKDEGRAYSHHRHNGTYDTALQLTGIDMANARFDRAAFVNAGRNTPFYKTIIPAMRDWFETEHYVFVHGWIPCNIRFGRFYEFKADWRSADPNEWEQARWYNGIEAAWQNCKEEKTVVCGHWHTSYGHCRIEHKDRNLVLTQISVRTSRQVLSRLTLARYTVGKLMFMSLKTKRLFNMLANADHKMSCN